MVTQRNVVFQRGEADKRRVMKENKDFHFYHSPVKNTQLNQMYKEWMPGGSLCLHVPFCQSVPLPSSLSLTQLATRR